MIRTKYSFSGVMIRGVEPDTGAALIKGYSPESLEQALAGGPEQGGLPGIILGKVLANSVGAIKGDKIVLVSSRGISSPMGQIPSMKQFQVTGIFESGMQEYDSVLAYMRLDQAQKLAGAKGRVSAVGVWLDDVFAVKNVKKDSLGFLGYPYYVRDWMDINQSLFSALKLEKTAMFIILTLIILVAAFNIASALIMMVMEKTKDIAVLKTMGATTAMIRRIFIFQGMIIGTLGTLAGTLAGVGLCALLKKYDFIRLPEAYPFSTLPIELETGDVLIIAVSALIICFLSTLYPSRRASKMHPVEAVRYG